MQFNFVNQTFRGIYNSMISDVESNSLQELQFFTSEILPDDIDRLLITNSNDKSKDKVIYELVVERDKMELKEVKGKSLDITKWDLQTGKIFRNDEDETFTIIDEFQDKINHILEDLEAKRSTVYDL